MEIRFCRLVVQNVFEKILLHFDLTDRYRVLLIHKERTPFFAFLFLASCLKRNQYHPLLPGSPSLSLNFPPVHWTLFSLIPSPSHPRLETLPTESKKFVKKWDVMTIQHDYGWKSTGRLKFNIMISALKYNIKVESIV